jgi:hypothetical protein
MSEQGNAVGDATVVDGLAELGKEELLAEMARARDAWQAMIASAGDRVDEPGPAGHWTLRDVVAHINAYHRFLVVNLGGAARDFDEMPEDVGMDTQKRNEWMHEQDRDRTWEFVTAESDELHRALVAQIEGRSPEQLRAPMVDWQPWPVWRWVIELTRGHYQEHTPDLQRWLSTD